MSDSGVAAFEVGEVVFFIGWLREKIVSNCLGEDGHRVKYQNRKEIKTCLMTMLQPMSLITADSYVVSYPPDYF